MIKKIIAALVLLTAFGTAGVKQELRGVWITNVDSRMLETDDAITEGVDYLASIGINVIFPVMWNGGYTLYPSAVLEKEIGVAIHPKLAGRDPLKKLIIEAHRRGIEVIPWLEYGFAARFNADTNAAGEILRTHPDWALRDARGALVNQGGGMFWMSGINPGPQAFMMAIIREIIDRYDVDGIQGDDRLPAMPSEGGYEDGTASIYKAEHDGQTPPADAHDPSWMRWRADKLNDFLKRMRAVIKARDENLIVATGPSEFAWGYSLILQDSKTWVDSGFVDNFIPQLYPDGPGRTFADYQFRLKRALKILPASKRPIFFAGVLANLGSYTIEPAKLVKIVRYNRSQGVNGECYFFYEGLRKKNNANGNALKKYVYGERALLPYRNGNAWRPRAVVLPAIGPDAVKVGEWKTNAGGKDSASASITAANSTRNGVNFYGSVPADAAYDVFVRMPAATPRIAPAQFILHDHRIALASNDIRCTGDWEKVGTVELKAGRQLILDVIGRGGDGTIGINAVMFMVNRQLSPGVVLQP